MSVSSPPELFFYNILFCHVRRFATQRPSSSSTSACQTSCPAVSTCRWPPPPSGSVPGVTVASCVICSLCCATDWQLCHSSPSSPSPSTATSWSVIRHYTQSTYIFPVFVWISEKDKILSGVKEGFIVKFKLSRQYRRKGSLRSTKPFYIILDVERVASHTERLLPTSFAAWCPRLQRSHPTSDYARNAQQVLQSFISLGNRLFTLKWIISSYSHIFIFPSICMLVLNRSQSKAL